MAQQWDVESATGRCSVTGEEFKEGDDFYTVLIEDGESFTRKDFSVGQWTGPPTESFCHFKTRVPVKEKPKQLLVNNHLLFAFFERLAGETEPSRIHFRFVLALLLMRKRLLRYDGTTHEGGTEIWELTVPRDKSSHRVVNPRLSDDQIAAVSEQLGAILHSDMGEWAAGSTESRTDDSVTGETGLPGGETGLPGEESGDADAAE